MRVPIPIVIISCILAAVLVWIAGTRDKDFMTPPTPEELVKISKDWEKSRPNIPPPKPIDSALLADKTITPPSKKPLQNKVKTLPTGNLKHSPALTEYGTLGNRGALAMIQLATQLETMGELQRALLAWERVIDTTKPSVSERKQAIAAIKRLRATLPPWNPDPTCDIAVTLHAGATMKDKDYLRNALTEAADLVSKASGNVIRVSTKASFGKSRGIKTPRIPIAIWFSRPKETPGETPPISFMADPSQKDMLVSQIEAGIYALLRAHLTEATSFTPLPEYPAGVNPKDLLSYHVTRLMWREFVNSMKE